jgi:hypothetical protein
MPSESRLNEILRGLVDRWCDRRALVPLATVLPAYLGYHGHTDQLISLFHALRTARGVDRPHVTEEEAGALGEAIAQVYQALKQAGIDVYDRDPAA